VEKAVNALWGFLITGALMLVYVVFLVRAAMRGRQWATDTLKAIAYMGDGSAAANALLVREAAERRIACRAAAERSLEA
jgi:hypothetical protein